MKRKGVKGRMREEERGGERKRRGGKRSEEGRLVSEVRPIQEG